MIGVWVWVRVGVDIETVVIVVVIVVVKDRTGCMMAQTPVTLLRDFGSVGRQHFVVVVPGLELIECSRGCGGGEEKIWVHTGRGKPELSKVLLVGVERIERGVGPR